MMSEAILAWGGSPLLEGLRLWARQDSRRDTRAQACWPTVSVSLTAEMTLVTKISTKDWSL